jgi:hypothetical protein
MEELNIKFQNAMMLINSDHRLIQLELCLEECEILILDLYFWNFYTKYKLAELRDTIVDCIIDIKLKPLW